MSLFVPVTTEISRTPSAQRARDEAVARFLRVPGLHAVDRAIAPQQAVAVRLINVVVKTTVVNRRMLDTSDREVGCYGTSTLYDAAPVLPVFALYAQTVTS